MSNPVTDKQNLYTYIHTSSNFLFHREWPLPDFQDWVPRFIKSPFKISNIWGEMPDLFLKATIAYLKHHSLATNPLLKTAVRSLYKACGIHHTHRFQKQMNARNPLCSKMSTLRTDILGLSAW